MLKLRKEMKNEKTHYQLYRTIKERENKKAKENRN